MIETERIGSSTGLRVRLQNANLVAIFAEKGYLFCGYLNLEAAEKMGDAACIVSGVSDFSEMLAAKVAKASSKALALGVSEGMSGREALALLGGT